MIKILVADDHPIYRLGVKHLIENSSDMRVVGEVDNGAGLLKKVFNDCFDVVLLDIAMPGKGVMVILEQLKAKKPNLPVLVVSMYSEEEYAIRVLKTGASGYLTKDSAPDELVTAIRTVYQGQKYISSSLDRLLASNLVCNEKKLPHENLSNREFQVMGMISSGKSLTKIADKLCLSVTTISTYRSRILEKMNLESNSELIHYAHQYDLIA